jgi:Fur family transcriptional regulator, zinc uptake regulator
VNELKLTKNQSLVLELLESHQNPLSAYSILEQLTDAGLRAPPQVYRALEKLIDYGLIHKLESINSYVACQHRHCGSHQVTSFAICDTCEQVSEIINQEFETTLHGLAERSGLNPTHSTVEIHGVCENCSNANH